MSTEAQILLERREWARGKVITAWLIVTKAIERLGLTARQFEAYDQAMHDAVAVAKEWGLDPKAIIAELADTPAETKVR